MNLTVRGHQILGAAAATDVDDDGGKMNSKGIANCEKCPTKLIDLQYLRNAAPKPNIYLIISTDYNRVDKYITLSHRWGGSSYMLQRENLEAMRRAIQLCIFPRAFNMQ